MITAIWFLIGLSLVFSGYSLFEKIERRREASYYTRTTDGYNEMYKTQFSGNWKAVLIAYIAICLVGIGLMIGAFT